MNLATRRELDSLENEAITLYQAATIALEIGNNIKAYQNMMNLEPIHKNIMTILDRENRKNSKKETPNG